MKPEKAFRAFTSSLVVPLVAVPVTAMWRPDALGSLLSMLSIIYAGVGALGAWMVVHEMRLDRKDRAKPLIFVDFPMTPDHETFVVVANAGGGVARDIRVEFEPPPVDHEGRPLTDLSLFRRPICYLLPGEDRQHFFRVSHDLLKSTDPVLFNVKVSCSDDEGAEYKWEYRVDLREWKDITGARRTIAQQLDLLNKRLEALSKALEKPIGGG